jgi:hypothetical protein
MKSKKYKTVYIHSAFGLWPMLEYELDIAQRELLAGSRVVFLYCRGNQISCEANKTGKNRGVKKRYCKECQSRVKAGLSWLEPKSGILEIMEYECLTSDQEEIVTQVLEKFELGSKDMSSIKGLINIDGIDIFESALSTVYSNLRVSKIKLDEYVGYLKNDISIALRSYYSALNHFERDQPDKVYIFNGRISRYRPYLRLAQKYGVETLVHEYPSYGFMDYSINYETYSHDRRAFSRQLYEVFQQYPLSNQDKINSGQAWYESRANRDIHGMEPVFVKNQEIEKLPDNWSDKNFNVVFYISSEDEIAGVKEVLEGRPCDQIDAIKIVANAIPELMMYVRLHPNLDGVDPEFTKELLGLDVVDNVKVIEAISKIDTYSMMRKSDLVISAGSTAGIEAAFIGKPVITVGSSQYEAFCATAQANTIGELINLVRDAVRKDFSKYPLEMQRKEGACAYAFSIQHFGIKPIYLKAENFKEGSYVWMNMFRDGVETRIRANWIYIIHNRLIDRWKSIFVQVIRLAVDKEKRSKFLHNPMIFIRAKLFSRLP